MPNGALIGCVKLSNKEVYRIATRKDTRFVVNSNISLNGNWLASDISHGLIHHKRLWLLFLSIS